MIQLTSLLKHWKLIAIVLLSIAVFWLYQAKTAIKQDRNRIAENFEQKDKQVSQMNLTLAEYRKLQSKDKTTIDSLCDVIGIKDKQLKEATVITQNYKDTNEVEPDYSEPTIEPQKPNEPVLSKPIYSIPISLDNDSCWGMKGVIKSTDPKARLIIQERIFNNSIQLLVVNRKRFLWWTIRKEQFRAFSDCDKELKVTRIKFVKK